MIKYLGSMLAAVFLLTLTATAGEFAIRGTTDKQVAIYKPGEPIEFTLLVLDGQNPQPGITLKWTRTGDDGVTEKGEGKTTDAGLKVTTKLDKPGFVRLQASAFGEDGKKLKGFIGGWGANKQGDIFFDGGACVDPDQLKPGEEPKDFDEFWKGMKDTLKTIPVKAERVEVASKNPKVKVYAVTVDCAGPKPVTGYLTIPANAKEKSLPAIVSFHGYGVNKHNAPGWLREDVITFDVNAHGMELGKDDAYYTKLKEDLKNYAFKNDENADPKKAYFYGMSLRVLRALEYAKSLPEWDGKTLQSNGGSQGGLQGLWGAGLDPDVTSSDIWSPWCCDLGGINQGRLRGWRPDYAPALDYYDPVFHAKRTKAKVKLIANYGDYTCPPSSVWVVYNEIPVTTKAMEVKQGCTHGYQMKNCMSYTITPGGVANIGEKK